MTDTADAPVRDYSKTLFLPKTDFPMRAELPKREPLLLERWDRMDLYRRLRDAAAGRPKFTLHDGPPYANGHLHIGHALNKILKDVVTRSQQMLGHDSNYVPGWDCHGLPIEWKVEEEFRAKGQNKYEIDKVELRKACRTFAEHWIDVQRKEFKRLGVTGDWDNPYLTMSFEAEAQIAREIMSFATSGQLYRGSKPVMWSVVEQTALAEAEVEYHDHTSPTVVVKFPLQGGDLDGASVLIWTTTPWTLPGNRAIAFSPGISYGLYEVTAAPADNWAKLGDRVVLADKLAADVFASARVETYERRADVKPEGLVAAHPLRGAEGAEGYYDFDVPLLAGDFVTEDTGTGFVHIAPGHGADDYKLWVDNGLGEVPHTVMPDGSYFPHVALFGGEKPARVLDDRGNEGDANKRVIEKLIEVGALVARGRLKHQYPHSWRSKAPLIFRNTPQWFIAMDRKIAGSSTSLRERALAAIDATEFVPPQGKNRLRGMIEARPDWVISRQRAWGVPITVFVHKKTGEVLRDPDVNQRIADAFEEEGADAWFADDGSRFLGNRHKVEDYEKVDDILDVWFDSGSTHAYVLDRRPDLMPKRAFEGGPDKVMYLEGSDQHRGWFHSSLLESCGTRGRAPFDAVLTHGFVLDEEGRKMSKSLGNTTAPQDVIAASGADILRVWVATSDYDDDLRIGPEILKTNAEVYRKLRNTLRWALGSLAHADPADGVPVADMPELERLMLHRLAELDETVREAYRTYDYKRVFAAIVAFATNDLSAFYFDIRKDALYCDPISSVKRRACLEVLAAIVDRLAIWLAPLIPFTAEEVWLDRHPGEDSSVHLQTFPPTPAGWRDEALAERWRAIREARRVVTGALEIERAGKRIGSSLEAAPVVHVRDAALAGILGEVDFAEICITSGMTVLVGEGPDGAFRLPEAPGIAVEPHRATGHKCARSWKISPAVGSDPDFPDVTPRDAEALRELRAAGRLD